MKKLTFLQGVAVTVALTSVAGIAGTSTIPGFFTFTPGTVISSSQVNSNFDKLANLIQSGQTQTYMGTWDAVTNNPDLGATASQPGDYYTVSIPGTYLGVAYVVGDRAIWNGSVWQRVPAPPSGVTSFMGRTGPVAPAKGDYNLDKLADVDVTTTPPAVNNILKFNGSYWVPGAAPAISETDPTVQPFAKTTMPVCGAGQMLQSNGSNFSCANIFTGAIGRVLQTSPTGQFETSSVTIGELGYLSGITSPIQTQLSSKEPMIAPGNTSYFLRGDKTWQPISTSVLTTPLAGFTTASVAAVTAADSIVVAIGKVQGQLMNKLNSTGGTLSVGTINGVPMPVASDDVASKGYVDSVSPWIRNGADTAYPSGSVLIGTTTPQATKLYVDGDASFTGFMMGPKYKVSTVGTATAPSFYAASGAGTGLFFPIANTMAVTTNGIERMRFDASGNVGIGITSPSYTLHVNGTAAGTSAYSNLSDIRYKKDIVRVSNALEKILTLDGVSYHFKNAEFPELKFSHRRELGVIAQKVEKVFPEAVSKDEKGFRSVAYTMLISPIIEALREVDTKTKNLEAENKMLKDYLCAKDPSAPFCE